MEIREFAERVLFATTLEEKLQPPPNITDERRGAALVTPPSPGRPGELCFKPTGTARDSFPGTRRLEQPASGDACCTSSRTTNCSPRNSWRWCC